LKAIKSNLKDGFGIIVEIERDSGNNCIITIYRKEAKPNNFHPMNTHHYEIDVQQKHIQNYTYVLKNQAPYNNILNFRTSDSDSTEFLFSRRYGCYGDYLLTLGGGRC
jgi:hypothetical protein